jgi:hypothetical protein
MHRIGIPRVAGKHPADPAVLDAVLTASRSLIAVATRSLDAAALAAFADAAGEIPDHRWPPGPDGTPADEAVQPSRPHEEAARVPAGPGGRS